MRSLFFLAAFAISGVLGVESLVDLGYSKYQGTDTGNGITQWLGMRYANKMTGANGLRFAAPQDPTSTEGIIQADKFGSICVSNTFKLTAEYGDRTGNGELISEDCLFVNVFAPTNASTSSKLPVYIFIQGGGFNANANPNYNGSTLIQAAEMDMIYVNFNYRVGPYGFLASTEIANNNSLSLNNGLKDQRQLLTWVKNNIQQFGGDPNHVVLGGASAGAGSVVLQLTAYGGRDDGLFQGAAAESQNFPALRTVDESEFMYKALLKNANCKNLACLQNMDIVVLQKAVRATKEAFPGASEPPLYFWGPTLDDDFVKDYTYNEFAKGNFIKMPTIFGDDTNDGLSFASTNVSSREDSENFVRAQFPSLTHSDFELLNATFVSNGTAAGWRQQAADMYGHMRYICPGLNVTSAYAKANQSAWNYRWNVGTALHTTEMFPVIGGGKSDPSQNIHQYWASFIRSYNPNHFSTYKYQDKKEETVTWKNSVGNFGQRILFNNTEVSMEDIPSLQVTRCNLINGLGVSLKQTATAPHNLHLPSWYTVYSIPFLVFILSYSSMCI